MGLARFAVFLGTLVLSAAPALADRWERQKGDCEQTFRSWRTQSVDKLRDCVMLWEMYRDISTVDADQRATVREPFDKLYQEGDKRDAVMALSALKKLGLRPTRLRDEAAPRDDTERQGEVVGKAPPARPRAPVTEEEPEEAPVPERKVDAREAKASYQRGIGYFKGGQYPEALSEFLISADSDPTYAQPLYMAAQVYVKLKKPAPAVEALARMKDLNSGLARQLMFQASADPVFAPLYGVDAFKALTGSAMIQLLNAGGPEAEGHVNEMAKQLEKAGLPVSSVSADRTRRENTYVYIKPGFEQQAERVRRQLSLGMVHKRAIDWPSEYDVIVAYGAKGKNSWVDDEAEKAGKPEDPKKKEDEDEARKAAEDAAKAKEDMKKKMQMIQMLQEMDAGKSAGDEAKSQTDVLPPP